MPLIIDIWFIGLYVVLFFMILTQVIIPVACGRKLFPMYRKNIRDADRRVEEMREEDYEENIAKRVQREEERRKKAAAAAMNTIIDVTTFRK